MKCTDHSSTLKEKRPGIRLPGGALLVFSRPLVMSIVNCTPDSFYEKSRALSPEKAVEKALEAEAEGADIIDFGAESTRPGAEYIDGETELRRLIPALRLFRRRSALPVSVDTRRAAVAEAALDEGADMVNDISALSDDEAMLPLCARRGAAVVLMHGAAEMRRNPDGEGYGGDGADAGNGVVGAAGRFLLEAARRAEAGGISREKIILDPGIGFGKTTADNLALINRLARIGGGDYPLLVGLSRKRFIGEITGKGWDGKPAAPQTVEERRTRYAGCTEYAGLAGTMAANAAALLMGADIIRVHDTAEAADLVKVIAALQQADAAWMPL